MGVQNNGTDKTNWTTNVDFSRKWSAAKNEIVKWILALRENHYGAGIIQTSKKVSMGNVWIRLLVSRKTWENQKILVWREKGYPSRKNVTM